MLIIGWNFHFDPLGSSGSILEICAALSLNLLMTQTVIQEPAWATHCTGGDDIYYDEVYVCVCHVFFLSF